MLIRIDHASATPLADQIAAGVRGAVIRGEVGPGDRLPSARALAESVDVNLHTVLRAYAALRDEGLIDLRRGRGAVIRNEFDSGATALHESAREFVRQARNLGLDTAHMLDLIKETSTQ
ncbi:MAG: GntR family transcriptional regulator [Rhodococcus sp. (in: high G+C Gram-positive bacteria)]|uniref:GntR family transcriptional regulator n=1 Tax=Rhodococcus sp. TaxID=1831 RepID=UPI00120D43A4|nr:GntR family transcriptional regulator [Rhodococcus sp. (in: high G+C Gram-positive bacteria)]RZL23366.1 MAG: GntR family transcriptional regulator [Rhodococcus sp. (in: high G+C Gram-positive bacteria)]